MFPNSGSLEISEAMSIVTVTEPPFSHGLMERYNFIIVWQSIRRITSRRWRSISMVPWCQKFFSKRPQILTVPTRCLDRTQTYHLNLVTNHQHTCNKLLVKSLTDNITALLKASEVCITSEASEKICRDFSNNIKSSEDTKYFTQHNVY